MAEESGITVRIRFQDESGNLVYQGTASKNLRLWGAVFETGSEAVDRAQGEFTGSYRYIRSLTAPGDAHTLKYRYDTRNDAVTVGGTEARKLSQSIGSFPVESIEFNYTKTALQGADKTVSSVTVTAQDIDTIFAGDEITLIVN